MLLRMGKRNWILAGLVLAVVGVGGALVAHRAVVPEAFCTAPGKEADVLRSYAAEPVISAPPVPGGPPGTPGTSTYCHLVGTEHFHPSRATGRWTDFQTTGWWPSKTLRARYDSIAAASGWTYVQQADEGPGRDACFVATVRETRYCEGEGVQYCKIINGVISLLDVTGTSRGDIASFPALIKVEIDALWNSTACPKV